MGANYINFVTQLVYGDLGVAELGTPAPAGASNHFNWTLDRLPSSTSTTVTGSEFLTHQVDHMLARYMEWRSKYFLPPVAPWDGTDIFPSHNPADPPVNSPDPNNLRTILPAGGAPGSFPAGWTMNDLGTAIRAYYNDLRNFNDGRTTELDDEIKAPFSYRYWAFMKWAANLRARLLVQPVFPTAIVYDRDGTILTEKEFCDHFNKVHHVWHPDSDAAAGATSWTEPTPGLRTAAGQFRRKKQLGRAQVGEEFFAFHRDHLELLDRWLARTGQDPVQSINMCAHEANPTTIVPGGLDQRGDGRGYPVVDYTTRAVNLAPPHDNIWDGSEAGFDGTLREFRSSGQMGQYFTTDFNPFPPMADPVPTANPSNEGYHGPGHNLNGDIRTPHANNYVPRFFAWHGFIDDIWAKRQPRFATIAGTNRPLFHPVLQGGADFPEPPLLTIVRELSTNTDVVEPGDAVLHNLTNGQGTLRVKARVRNDPFGRRIELNLLLEVLREAGGTAPVITISRNLVATPGAPAAAAERQQGLDFIEDFVFDGSAGTVDSLGRGPFVSDNLQFPPAGSSAVGFVNSRIRVTGTLRCARQPDNTVAPVSGTISSSATLVSGVGTQFRSQLRQGDLIRAAGQVRTILADASINPVTDPVGTELGIPSDTSLLVTEAFSPALAAGTAFERLDGFDHIERFEIPLMQEKQGPDVEVFLNRSTFSLSQVQATATFDDSFYVVLQDRTVRPAPIAWPPDTLPELYGVIAGPVPAAGLFADLAHRPAITIEDATTNVPLAGQMDVEVMSMTSEDLSLHPSVAQRLTYACRVVFTGAAAFAGMNPGNPPRALRLKVVATDRSGNRTTFTNDQLRLTVDANPYMLDGPVSWLSTDTRVFQIQQGQSRFGIAMASDPTAFIQQVIDALRTGNGTAGGESFDSLPTDQGAAYLEYSAQVGVTNVYNFAVARVRLVSATPANNVRTSFRLFRWGTANVEFDPDLAYRSASTSVALLGRTSTNELASIPFFSEPRVAVTSDMNTQPDAKNLLLIFPATGTSEGISYFGAYLDINQTDVRFPATYQGDGGFGGVPPANMRSIRNLLMTEHQCMIVEVAYSLDPTVAGATPGTSDNLAQRNLLIVQTANPGSSATRTVHHAFDVDLTRRRSEADPDLERRVAAVLLEPAHVEHGRSAAHHGGTPPALRPFTQPRPARPARFVRLQDGHGTRFSAATEVTHGHGSSWLEQDDPKIRAVEQLAANIEAAEDARWRFDPDRWKRSDGVDELVLFWNNLPTTAKVEVYLPGAAVEEIVNLRNLRHAPGTVKIVDSQTLRLMVAGSTYLPVPPFFGDHLAGLFTVALPEGIHAGERYVVDVIQVRTEERKVLGGFQLLIQVDKSGNLLDRETRTLQLFHERLGLLAREDRWRPILARQISLTRARARGFAQDVGVPWTDPTTNERGQRLRVVLDRIQILDDQDPWLKGQGEFRFRSRAQTRNNGGSIQEHSLPRSGQLAISDEPGRNIVRVDMLIFEGFVEDHLAIEVTGVELDRFDPDDDLCRYRRVFRGSPETFLGSYGPADETAESEDLGDWRLWYRIERA